MPQKAAVVPSPVKNHEDVLRLQRETKKKGKKRIMPVLVSSGEQAVEMGGAALQDSQGGQDGFKKARTGAQPPPAPPTTTDTSTAAGPVTNVLAARKKVRAKDAAHANISATRFALR